MNVISIVAIKDNTYYFFKYYFEFYCIVGLQLGGVNLTQLEPILMFGYYFCNLGWVGLSSVLMVFNKCLYNLPKQSFQKWKHNSNRIKSKISNSPYMSYKKPSLCYVVLVLFYILDYTKYFYRHSFKSFITISFVFFFRFLDFGFQIQGLVLSLITSVALFY